MIKFEQVWATLLVHEVMPSSFAAETSLSHAQEDEPHFCAKANWLILRCLIIRNYRPFNLILKHQFLFQDEPQTLYNFQASVICFFSTPFWYLCSLKSLIIIYKRWRVPFFKKTVYTSHAWIQEFMAKKYELRFRFISGYFKFSSKLLFTVHCKYIRCNFLQFLNVSDFPL